MKKYIIFLAALVITFVNFVLLTFWFIDVKYKLEESALNQKYKIPFNLKIDYWGFDISANNYGVVLLDSNDFLILNRDKMILPEQIVLGDLDSIFFNCNKIWVVSRRDKIRKVIEIKADHRLLISDDANMIGAEHYLNLKDQDLISWLKYKNSKFIDFTSLTIILLASLFLNLYLIKMFLQKVRKKRDDITS